MISDVDAQEMRKSLVEIREYIALFRNSCCETTRSTVPDLIEIVRAAEDALIRDGHDIQVPNDGGRQQVRFLPNVNS